MSVTMKAICAHARGGAEVLVYEDAPRPTPGRGDALLRVGAAAITPTELTWPDTWETGDGKERLPSIPAHEASGIVAELGPDATGVQVGDRVYALTDFHRNGAAAEYAVVRAADLAPRPRSLDDVHAAAVPLAALTAWQALFDHAGLAAGQSVLIHGAAGGVGTYAVQLARWKGARVAATASGADAAFVRDMGADVVIDHRTERFEDRVRDVDVVLDAVGGETLRRSWTVLRRGGTLVSIVEAPSQAEATSRGVRGVYFIVEPDRDRLVRIADLVDAGQLRPVIDAVFPLPRAREAFDRALHGHHRGKIVLAVQQQ